MKFRQILMVVAGVLLVQYEWAVAADLSQVRTGKHENFARVVFEFQGPVQFDRPEIKGKGTFSLVFLNSTTKLSPMTEYKTGKIQMVRSIEYVRQKSDLTAIVKLTFPYFMLKSYALSAPDRIVVDAYWMTSPVENSEQTESLPKEASADTVASPDKKELKNTNQQTPEIAAPAPATASSTVEETPPNVSQKSQSTFSTNVSNQALEKRKPLLPPVPKEHSMAQTYLLAVLDVIAGCIVILLFFMLFSRKQRINVGHLCEILDFIKSSDRSIADIDAKIQSAFKKYDQT